MNKLVLLLLLAASAAATQAQSVWRCGPDGRSYTDAPCPDGQAVLVTDSRSAADVAEARAVAARDRRLAQQLVIERREREREALSSGNGLMAVTTASRPDVKPAGELKVRQRGLRAQAVPKRRGPAGAGTSRSTARETRQTQG